MHITANPGRPEPAEPTPAPFLNSVSRASGALLLHAEDDAVVVGPAYCGGAVEETILTHEKAGSRLDAVLAIELRKHRLRPVRRKLENRTATRALAVRAAAGKCRAVQVARFVHDHAGLGNQAVTPTLKGIEHSLCSVRRSLENRTAAEFAICSPTTSSCRSIQISGTIHRQSCLRCPAITSALKVVNDAFRTALRHFEYRAAAQIAPAAIVWNIGTAEVCRSIKVSRLIPGKPRVRHASVASTLKSIKNGFRSVGTNLEYRSTAAVGACRARVATACSSGSVKITASVGDEISSR